MTWQALPEGDAITFQPGWFYAVIASVKASHSVADIHALAQKRGLVLGDYAEQGTRPGLGPDPRTPDYRYVAAIAQAQAAGSLPWGVPWPFSMVDDSHLVEAWASPPGVAPPAPSPGPAPAPAARTAPLWPIVAVLAGGAAWDAWRSRRGRGRLTR